MTVVEKQAENAKNKNISEVTGFTKSQPTGFDADSILQKDDVIVFPATMPKVFKQVFGEDADGNDIYAEFIIVEVEHPGKATRAINFFPSSLTKNIWASKKNADGEIELVTGRPLNPKGTAVAAYVAKQGEIGPNGETDMELGMREMLGKKVHVADAEQIDVQVFRNGKRVNQLKKTNLFTYNFA